MNEIEKAGGMVKAIEKGIPQRKIEVSAATKQAKIDSAQQTIVGVNKYRYRGRRIEVLDIDNQAVKRAQIEKLNKSKKTETKIKLKQH